MDRTAIEKAFDSFVNDDFSTAEEILRSEIRSSVCNHIQERTGVESISEACAKKAKGKGKKKKEVAEEQPESEEI